MRRLLAGDDQPDKPGLPLAELLAPLPLLCLALLFLNDWILKPTSLPIWLTGKLSDFAGLAVFPLVATAAFDLVLLALWKLGAPIDFTLRRWKLLATIGLTGGLFALMKLVPAAASVIAHGIPGHAVVVPDASDLIALPALAIAWWFGRNTIARGAYGRCAWARRARPASPFGDAAVCGADREAVTALDRVTLAWIDGGAIDPVRAALARLR